MKTTAYSLILIATLSSFSLAHSNHHSHSNHNHSHSNHNHSHNIQGIAATIMQSMHQPMMENSPIKSGSANKDFLANMIPHHQGAILASEAVLKVPNLDPRIRRIAKSIIKEQEKEIILFNSLLHNKNFSQTSNKKAYENFYNESEKAMASMMDKMNKIYENNPQKAFLVGMIPHHQGAVAASKQILKITKDSNIIEIARDIIREQNREIAKMQKILKGME